MFKIYWPQLLAISPQWEIRVPSAGGFKQTHLITVKRKCSRLQLLSREISDFSEKGSNFVTAPHGSGKGISGCAHQFELFFLQRWLSEFLVHIASNIPLRAAKMACI